MIKLAIGRLRSTVLTSRHNQRHSLPLSQGADKALKQVSGVLLKPRRGAFGNSGRRKLKKILFSHDRKHFSGGQFAKVARLGHRQKKRGVKVGGTASFVWAQEGAKKRAN